MGIDLHLLRLDGQRSMRRLFLFITVHGLHSQPFGATEPFDAVNGLVRPGRGKFRRTGPECGLGSGGSDYALEQMPKDGEMVARRSSAIEGRAETEHIAGDQMIELRIGQRAVISEPPQEHRPCFAGRLRKLCDLDLPLIEDT
ncbi:hypothetical protein BSN85_35205 [Bradyrhizobium brasilense]|nr:hypothetical protein BSN85_35205 [Bradyrhizobium brasilense]